MEFTLVAGESTEGESPVGSLLDEIAREGARRMLLETLEVEAEEYVRRLRSERDERDHALVTRNGYARERTVQFGSGAVKVRAPRVNDRRVDEAGERQRFQSRVLPPYVRRSPSVATVLPVLYLRGLSSGDFTAALEPLLGEQAAGLSPASIVRLTKQWTQEYETWSRRDLSSQTYAYLWVDGVYFNVRLEEDRLACLVVVGVRQDGSKEVLTLSDGYRECAESWAAVLRDLKARGMNEPLLAIGDGALGFWKALRQVGWNTGRQRCWVHKIANVLSHLPKRLQPKVKTQLHAMMYAESRAEAEAERERFRRELLPKQAKAVNSLEDGWEELMTFFDFPAEHWEHLRTTNPVESLFSTVKHRLRTTKGAGSRNAALAMAFKLTQAAEENWRRVNAPERVAQLLAGATFRDGEIVTEEAARADAA